MVLARIDKMKLDGLKRIGLIPALMFAMGVAGHCANLGDSPGLCFLPGELAAVAAIAPVPVGACATSAAATTPTDPTTTVTIPVTVQTGTLSLAGPGGAGTYTAAATITAVDTASSFLIFQTRHNSNRPPGSTVRGTITNSTTVTFSKTTDETTTLNIRWYVITYPSAYVKVQTGTVTRTTNPVAQGITAVGALSRAFTMHSQTPAAADGSWNNDDAVAVSLSATNSLRVNANAANAAHVLRWQAVEYLDATHIDVQSNTTTLTGGALSVNVNLSTAVDMSRTFPLVSLITNGTGADIGARLLRARFTGTSTVLVERGIGGDADDMAEIHVQTVELKDGSSVQSGVSSFTAGQAQKIIAITSVDTTKSAALISGQSGAGQTMGMSDYAGDDIAGVCAVTTTLTSTQLTLDRDNTAGSCDVAWYVVKFGT